MNPQVLEHLERCLGSISEVFAHDENGQPLHVPIGAVHDAPYEGAITLVTLGLSDYELEQGKGPVRQELMFGFWSRFGFRNAPALLDYWAQHAIHSGQAFLRGNWDSYNAPIIDNTAMTGLTFEPPVGYAEGLFQLTGVFAEPVIVISIIPLTTDETDFRTTHGWPDLEDRLERPGVDLLDLDRPSSV